ncbi:hypothetical protein JL720_16256 [Aureococcus anophagefferens]|nr:hypothetical protein JL720_16256 [Aureococcus anophagefferens]
MRKFPNQFEPFAHLPFGVSERGIAAGTILRLPLRGDFFVDGELGVFRPPALLYEFRVVVATSAAAACGVGAVAWLAGVLAPSAALREAAAAARDRVDADAPS